MKTTLLCLHPKTITTSDGRQIVVSCGECAVCRNSARSSILDKLNAEVRKHRFTYFGTLTYADRFIPRICIREAAYYIDQTSDSGFCTRYEYRLPGYPYWPKFLESLKDSTVHRYRFELFGDFTEESLSQCRNYSYELDRDVVAAVFERLEPHITPYVPVLNYRDFQLFMKRFRKKIHSFCVTNKLTSNHEKISYHVVGEYGPLHFRPHYHFLLFCDSEQVAGQIVDFVSSCWTFGYSSTSLAGSGSAGYVASYLNCYSYLPRFYTDYCRFWRPFSRGSIGIGTPDQKDFSEAELFADDRFDSDVVANGSTYVQSSVSRSHFYRLYSRVSSFFGRGVEQTYGLFCRISQVYREFGYDSKKEKFTSVKTLKSACCNYVASVFSCKWIGNFRYCLMDSDLYPVDSLAGYLSYQNSDSAEYVRFDLVVLRLYTLANNIRNFLALFRFSLYDFLSYSFTKFSLLCFHISKYVDRLRLGSLSSYFDNLVKIDSDCDSAGFSASEKLDALFSFVRVWYGACLDTDMVYERDFEGFFLPRSRICAYARMKVSELLDFFRLRVKHREMNDNLLFNSKYLNQYGRFIFS